MKLTIAFCLAVIVAVQADPREAIKAIMEKCCEELSADCTIFKPNNKEEIMKKTKEDHSYKCLSKCMSLKSGTIDEDGNVNEAKIEEFLPPQMKDKKADMLKCFDENKGVAELCERMNKVHECAMKVFGFHAAGL